MKKIVVIVFSCREIFSKFMAYNISGHHSKCCSSPFTKSNKEISISHLTVGFETHEAKGIIEIIILSGHLLYFFQIFTWESYFFRQFVE